MDKEKFYTTREAAEILKISVMGVRWKIKNGHFPHAKKYGRDWIIPESDISDNIKK